MEVNITKEAASASNLVARRIARLVREKPDEDIGLATCSTLHWDSTRN
ncbi:MAG: hypothetical protein WCI42_06515 [Verrucomicrobiota bacterium]